MLKQSAPLLHWFAEALVQPLTGYQPRECAEAEQYLTPGPKLTPSQCMGIYNQQYWLRFFRVMEDSFPTVARLFGSQPFQQMLVVPYVQAHAPRDWSIDLLGAQFPQWLGASYQGDDRALVVLAAEVDWAICQGPIKPHHPPATPTEAAAETIYRQPHVSLWNMPWVFPPLRQQLLEKPVDGWLNQPFPQLEKQECWWLLARDCHGAMIWRQLTETQYQLLKRLHGSTLAHALENLPDSAMDEAVEGVTAWFMEWAYHGWLTTHVA